MVAAHPAILAALDAAPGPWTISAAAHHIARAALDDANWIAAARQRLPQDSARPAALLAEHGLASVGGGVVSHLPTPARRGPAPDAGGATGMDTRIARRAAFWAAGRRSAWQQLAQSLAGRFMPTRHPPIKNIKPAIHLSV